MNIEELAFKDRATLAQLNELVLLDIIEFLQLDRKQWINQFTQTHNESVDIQKENQELKEQLEDMTLCRDIASGHRQEVQDRETILLNQQKEFINYLEKRYKDVTSVIGSYGSNTDMLYGKKDMIEEILQKYKETIGVSEAKNRYLNVQLEEQGKCYENRIYELESNLKKYEKENKWLKDIINSILHI